MDNSKSWLKNTTKDNVCVTWRNENYKLKGKVECPKESKCQLTTVPDEPGLVLVLETKPGKSSLRWSDSVIHVDERGNETLDDVVIVEDTDGVKQLWFESHWLVESFSRAVEGAHKVKSTADREGKMSSNIDEELFETSNVTREDAQLVWDVEKELSHLGSNIKKQSPKNQESHKVRKERFFSRDGETEEDRVMKKRLKKTKEALQKLAQTDKDINCDLKIGLACSGGGLRAMLGTIGFLDGLKEIGLLNCISHVVGLSGSSWALSTWFVSESSPFHSLSKRATDPLAFHGELTDKHKEHKGTIEMTTGYPTFKKWLQHASKALMTHIWSNVLNMKMRLDMVDVWADFLGNMLLANEHKGEHREVLFEMNSKKKTELEKGHYPYPIMTAVTRRDSPTSREWERPRRWTWLEFMFSEIGSDELGAWIKTEGFAQRAEGGKVSSPRLNTMLAIFGSAMSFDTTCAIDTVFSSESTLSRLIKRLTPEKLLKASIPGFVKRINSFVKGSDEKIMDLRDAGMDFNVPFPVFDPERNRKFDVVLVLDCTGGASGPKELEHAVKSGYMAVDLEHLKVELKSGEAAVFESQTHSDKKYPKVVYVMGPVTPSTLNFSYSEADVKQVIQEGYSAATNNKAIIFSALKQKAKEPDQPGGVLRSKKSKKKLRRASNHGKKERDESHEHDANQREKKKQMHGSK